MAAAGVNSLCKVIQDALVVVPVPALQFAFITFKSIWDLVQEMSTQKTQAETLVELVAEVLLRVQSKLAAETRTPRVFNPRKDSDYDAAAGAFGGAMAENVKKLEDSLQQIHRDMSKFVSMKFMKRLIQRDEIADTITRHTASLPVMLQLFCVEAHIDTAARARADTAARNADSQKLDNLLNEAAASERRLGDLIKLDHSTRRAEMAEIKDLLSFCARQIRANAVNRPERAFYEATYRRMQRLSGGRVAEPPSWTVSPLEVEMDEEIGEGAYSTVYHGKWNKTEVAIKVLVDGIPEKTLLREAEIWRRLDHPRVHRFLRACLSASPPFIVSTYHPNGDILKYMEAYPEADRLSLLRDIASGMAYLHSQDCLHGDLKGSNVLVDVHGRACVSDFGLSRVIAQSTMVSTRSLKSNSVVTGTSSWMSPERLQGSSLSQKVDVYAFAMTAYEISTNEPPFAYIPEGQLYSLVVVHSRRPPRPPNLTSIFKLYPDEVWKLVEQCWSQDPDQRPNFDSILLKLDSLIGTPVLPTVPLPSIEPTPATSKTMHAPTHSLPESGFPVGRFKNTPSPKKEMERGTLSLPLKLPEQPPPIRAPVGQIPPGTVASQPTIASLMASASRAFSPDALERVSWCQDVLTLVKKAHQLAGGGPDEPARIADQDTIRLANTAIETILQLTVKPLPDPLTLAVAKALQIRGTLYLTGLFPSRLARSPRLAFTDFDMAARGGYHPGWYNMGCSYEEVGDYTRAKKCFSEGMRHGVAECYHRMGMIYLLGQLGSERSAEKGLPLLHSAASRASIEHPQSAHLYALILLSEAPDITVPPAVLQSQIPEDATLQSEARKYLERAAYFGHVAAQCRLGHAYQFGTAPYPYSPLDSVKWYTLASQQESAEAIMALSRWYWCGAEGCFESDEQMAFSLAQRAAAKGLPDAEFAMGFYAETGVGRAIDLKEAVEWYKKAAEHGADDASSRLAELSYEPKARRPPPAEDATDLIEKETYTVKDYPRVIRLLSDPSASTRFDALGVLIRITSTATESARHHLVVSGLVPSLLNLLESPLQSEPNQGPSRAAPISPTSFPGYFSVGGRRGMPHERQKTEEFSRRLKPEPSQIEVQVACCTVLQNLIRDSVPLCLAVIKTRMCNLLVHALSSNSVDLQINACRTIAKFTLSHKKVAGAVTSAGTITALAELLLSVESEVVELVIPTLFQLMPHGPHNEQLVKLLMPGLVQTINLHHSDETTIGACSMIRTLALQGRSEAETIATTDSLLESLEPVLLANNPSLVEAGCEVITGLCEGEGDPAEPLTPVQSPAPTRIFSPPLVSPSPALDLPPAYSLHDTPTAPIAEKGSHGFPDLTKSTPAYIAPITNSNSIVRPERKSVRREIVQANLCLTLSSLLTHDSVDVQTSAFKALCGVSMLKEARAPIRGCLATVGEVMNSTPSDRVILAGCDLVKAVIDDDYDSIKAAAASSTLITAIIECLASDSVLIVQAACSIISNILGGTKSDPVMHDQVTAKVIQEGGCSLLVDCLHNGSIPVKGAACDTLFHLSKDIRIKQLVLDTMPMSTLQGLLVSTDHKLATSAQLLQGALNPLLNTPVLAGPDIYVRGLYTFTAAEEGELAFRKGDVLKVVKNEYKDWWMGELRGKTGIFPTNYVKVIPHDPKVLFYVAASYDYSASIEEEFDFKAGDVIAVTNNPADGWWSGYLLDKPQNMTPGKEIFPSNFVSRF